MKTTVPYTIIVYYQYMDTDMTSINHHLLLNIGLFVENKAIL